jgi:predicted metal-binding transcription factor (methanogenesis marker protein 9)
MKTLNLTEKEIIELRLKCLAPYVTIASKVNIEQDTVIKKAEVAWQYAIKPLMEADPSDNRTPITGSGP